ncbi:hypothetical protein CDAR_310601 [Caerostris darwini]|uniref:Uncharacterized protein n=1 Tax=Caerostris darwini TaxID=1538125 RepID=A0AAV4WQ55_9ARAC|nr:hypothetical protein CDAR_310601 [Caerostris darwini]
MRLGKRVFNSDTLPHHLHDSLALVGSRHLFGIEDTLYCFTVVMEVIDHRLSSSPVVWMMSHFQNLFNVKIPGICVVGIHFFFNNRVPPEANCHTVANSWI